MNETTINPRQAILDSLSVLPVRNDDGNLCEYPCCLAVATHHLMSSGKSPRWGCSKHTTREAYGRMLWGDPEPQPVDLLAAMQALYDSEIHFRFIAVWDRGFEVEIPRMVDQPRDDFRACFQTVAEAIEGLCRLAIARYPQSRFAREWGPRFTSQ